MSLIDNDPRFLEHPFVAEHDVTMPHGTYFFANGEHAFFCPPGCRAHTEQNAIGSPEERVAQQRIRREQAAQRAARASRAAREGAEHGREAELQRLAEHLASEVIGDPLRARCDLTTDNGTRACRGKAAGIKWEDDGFADLVCEHHGEKARDRGALVITPRRHDGTQRAEADDRGPRIPWGDREGWAAAARAAMEYPALVGGTRNATDGTERLPWDNDALLQVIATWLRRHPFISTPEWGAQNLLSDLRAAGYTITGHTPQGGTDG